MRPVLLSLLCAVPVSLFADQSAYDIASHDDVVAIFDDLLRSGWNGMLQTESAAFIVRDDAGAYQCVEWPFTGALRRQTYRGPTPPSTVAIAHTHPKSARLPSTGDYQTAARVGVPVFVITPENIYAATPDGSTVALVEKRPWALDRERRDPCAAGRVPQSLSAE